MHPSTQLRGIGYALFSYTAWVIADTFIKLASEYHIPPGEIVGFLGLYSVVMLAIKATIQSDMKKLWPKKPRPQLVRAALDFLATFLGTIALKHLPLPIFYVVVFCTPLMTAIGAAVFLKEHLKIGKILAIIAGFTGVMIAINFSQNISSGDLIGYAAGFASAICSATGMIWLRVMTQTETVDSIAFTACLVFVVLGFGTASFHLEPVNGKLLLIFFAMSVTGLAGGLSFFKALQLTTAAHVAQLHYTQLITGSVIAWFIWHDIPTIHLIIGAIIIIASGLYMASQARKSDKATLIQ